MERLVVSEVKAAENRYVFKEPVWVIICKLWIMKSLIKHFSLSPLSHDASEGETSMAVIFHRPAFLSLHCFITNITPSQLFCLPVSQCFRLTTHTATGKHGLRLIYELLNTTWELCVKLAVLSTESLDWRISLVSSPLEELETIDSSSTKELLFNDTPPPPIGNKGYYIHWMLNLSLARPCLG